MESPFDKKLNYKADDYSHANNKLKIISEIQTKKIEKCDTYKREFTTLLFHGCF